MKKICFVATVEFAVNVYLINHLRALSQLYDTTVIVNTNNPNFLANKGIKVNVVKLGFVREISLMNDLITLIKLISIFRRYRFDAVHSMMPKSGLLAMMAAWVARTPVRVHTFTGQIWVNKAGIKRFLFKKIDSLIAFLATSIIVDSPSQLQFLLNEEVAYKESSLVFCSGSISGVDISRFKPDKNMGISVRQQLSIDDDAVVFLFLGRLTQDKGVLDLAQAFNQVQTKNTHLVFVGPDEKHTQHELVNVTLPCADKVHFVGYTDTPECYMAAADVLCLPSYREGFGGVIIEAAAVGIPSIASRIYGITDAVVEGETGLLHEPRNIVEIKVCMEELVNNPALRLKLGEQAKKRAVESFNSSLLTQAWVNFYQKKLQRNE